MFSAMMASACPDCVFGDSWPMATFMAARTSGGRSVEVRTMRDKTLSKKAAGIPAVYVHRGWSRRGPADGDTTAAAASALSCWSNGEPLPPAMRCDRLRRARGVDGATRRPVSDARHASSADGADDARGTGSDGI